MRQLKTSSQHFASYIGHKSTPIHLWATLLWDIRIIWWNEHIWSLPGGEALLKPKSEASLSNTSTIACISPDSNRDAAALALVEHQRIWGPSYVLNSLLFACYSALAMAYDPHPISYQIWLGYSGVMACTCPDFKNHTMACKHAHAAVIKAEQMRSSGINIPFIPIHKSESEAWLLWARCLAIAATSLPVSEVQ